MSVGRGFDLVVIGGGAAGLTAASEAGRRGARTALVADGPLAIQQATAQFFVDLDGRTARPARHADHEDHRHDR